MENKSPGTFRRSLVFSLQLTALISLLHVLRVVTGFPPLSWGILARDTDGLIGVGFAPLLHGSWGHLFSNIPPLAALAFHVVLFLQTHCLAGVQHDLPAHRSSGLGAGPRRCSACQGQRRGIWIGRIRVLERHFQAQYQVYHTGTHCVDVLRLHVCGYFSGKEGISWESHLLGALAGIFELFGTKTKRKTTKLRRVIPGKTKLRHKTIPFLSGSGCV